MSWSAQVSPPKYLQKGLERWESIQPRLHCECQDIQGQLQPFEVRGAQMRCQLSFQ